MKKILVLGGSGFIGKYLVRTLIQNSEVKEVVVVDDLSSALPDWYDIATDQRGGGRKEYKVRFIESTVENYAAFAESDFDQIYHLAAPVGPVGVLKKAGKISTEIVGDLSAMAMLALDCDCPITYISTSEVYGKSAVFNQAEDLDKIVPSKYTVRLEYGVAKLLGEIMLDNLAKTSSLKYTTIRPFNIAGPGQNAALGFVLPRFCQQVLNGEDITVYGDGTNRRTFTHVMDFVNATIAASNCGYYNTVFNIGNPDNQITIAELARKVLELGKRGKSPSKLSFVNPKTLHGDTFEEAWNKIPSIDRLQALTGFEFKYGTSYIVGDTFEYERKNAE